MCLLLYKSFIHFVSPVIAFSEQLAFFTYPRINPQQKTSAVVNVLRFGSKTKWASYQQKLWIKLTRAGLASI